MSLCQRLDAVPTPQKLALVSTLRTCHSVALGAGVELEFSEQEWYRFNNLGFVPMLAPASCSA